MKRKPSSFKDAKRLTYFSETVASGENVEYDDLNGDLELVGEDKANLVSSQTVVMGCHKPVIDIDIPDVLRLVPSSTPGHCHLYIDHGMTEAQMLDILRAFMRAGLVEEGYYKASEARGMTLVRPPHVTKPKARV